MRFPKYNAPETSAVDFKRKVELRNPEAKISVLENDVKTVSVDA